MIYVFMHTNRASDCIYHSFFLYRLICIYELMFLFVPFQYTIPGDKEQMFLLYYKDFFEQICSDVQFISPPEEVGEFLLHLLKNMQNRRKQTGS